MKSSVYLVFFGFVLSACEFEPSKVVVTEVAKPSLEGITINLNNYPAGPINVTQVTEFTFSVATAGRPLLQVRVSVDQNNSIPTLITDRKFSIDPIKLSTGSHTLRIEAVMPSGSGSLADKVEAEVIDVLIERQLIVDHSIPDDPSDPNAVAITSVENVDGTIVVNWNAYNKINFQGYKVSRLDYAPNGVLPTAAMDFTPITSPAVTFMVDKSYLYGKSVYSITLTADGKSYTSPGFTYELPYQPRLDASLGLDGKLVVKWNSLKGLENNLSTYRLQVTGTNFSEGLVDKNEVTDTVYTLDVPDSKFGNYLFIKLDILSLAASTRTLMAKVTTGSPFPFYDYNGAVLHYDVTTQAFYGVKYSPTSAYPRIIKWNSNGILIDSTDNTYSRYVFATGVPLAIANNKNGVVRKIDLTTMSEMEVSSMPAIEVLSVSDNMKFIGYNSQASVVTIYSEAGQVLLPDAGGLPSSEYDISGNGLYAAFSNKLFKYNGTAFDFWTYFDGYQRNSISFLDDESIAIIGLSNKLVKFDIETKTVLQTTTTYFGRCNIDPVSKKIGCASNETFVVLNPDDLSLYKSVPIVPNANFYYLFNESIICPGAQIKLSEIP